MPRKRRKRIATESAPDIPYPRVRVEWIDCVSDSGWATDKEFDRMKFAKPINEGWLYSKDKNSIKLFASYDKDDETVRIFAGYDVDDDGSITFSERSVFPTSCVKKITRVH